MLTGSDMFHSFPIPAPALLFRFYVYMAALSTISPPISFLYAGSKLCRTLPSPHSYRFWLVTHCIAVKLSMIKLSPSKVIPCPAQKKAAECFPCVICLSLILEPAFKFFPGSFYRFNRVCSLMLLSYPQFFSFLSMFP